MRRVMILLLCLLLPWVALGEDNAQIVSFSTFTCLLYTSRCV